MDGPLHAPVPRKIVVLCRDILAADSQRSDAIQLSDELQRELRHWSDDMRRAEQEAQEREARELRRQLRRNP